MSARRSSSPQLGALERAALRRALERGLAEPIAALEPTLGYRVAMLLAALTMVTLPLLYVGLIVAIMGLLGAWATWRVELLEAGEFFPTFFYFGPLVGGALIVAFLIKPLFTRPLEVSHGRGVTAAEEPELFAFVQKLCRVTGAPMPAEIRLTMDVNASASFAGGLRGYLSGALVLEVGLPLLAGFSVSQLAGTLAHELGHFAQGAGMRLSGLVRRVNLWFARVVFERDAWDRRLESWSELWMVGIVFIGARFVVGCGRLVLHGLMLLGVLVAGYVLRQMEYDADRYETQVVGSEGFVSTSARIIELTVWWNGVLEDLDHAHRHGRLPDDLAISLLGQEAQFDPKAVPTVLEAHLELRTGFFDTHPAQRERNERARALGFAPRLTVGEPASVLMADMPALSRSLTAEYYRELLDEESLESLVIASSAEELARSARAVANVRAFERFAQGLAPALRPWGVAASLPAAGEQEEGEDAEARRRRLEQLRGEQSAAAKSYGASYQSYDELDSRWLELAGADAVLRAGFKMDRGTFDLAEPNHAGVDATREEALEKQRLVAAELMPFEEAIAQRLVAGLLAGAHGELELDLLSLELDAGAEAWDQEVASHLQALAAIEEALPGLLVLRNTAQGALFLAEVMGGADELPYGALLAMDELAKELREQLEASSGDLEQVLYPNPVGGGEVVSLARYALGEDLEEEHEMVDIAQRASEYTRRLVDARLHLSGRLMALAEQVEAALGFAPLESMTAEES